MENMQKDTTLKKIGLRQYLFVAIVLVALSLVIYFVKYPYGTIITIACGTFLFLVPLAIKDPEAILMLIGFFLPFERVPSMEIGGLNIRTNYVLVIVLLFFYLTVKAAKRELKIPRDPIFYLVLIFFVSLIFSFSQAVNRSRAIQVLLSMLLMVVSYFTVTLVAQDKKTLVRTVKGILFGAAVATVFGFYQFLGDMIGLPNSLTLLKVGYDKSTFGFARIQAGSQEPLYFANYIFIPLSILIVTQLRGVGQKLVSKWFAVLLTIMLMICFILAISRGAYLAAGLVFIVLVVVQAKLVFRLKILLPVVAAILIILLGAYFALSKSEPRAINEFVSHLLVQDYSVGESVVLRLSSAEQAKEIFSAYPILGVGPGNFGPVILGDPVDKPTTGWPVVNNEYLEILAENGIVGLIAFCLLIIAVFWRGIVAFARAKDVIIKALILAFLLALFAILVQYATFSTLYIFHIWFLLGLCGAVANIVLNKESRIKN